MLSVTTFATCYAMNFEIQSTLNISNALGLTICLSLITRALTSARTVYRESTAIVIDVTHYKSGNANI